MTRRIVWGLALVGSVGFGGLGAIGCGKQGEDSSSRNEREPPDSGGAVDGAVDGSFPVDLGDADDPVDAGGGNECLKLGASCGSAGDCCSGICQGEVCATPACTSDDKACTTDTDCCSGRCEEGSCAPLNSSCKTLGNACSSSAECCSGRCADDNTCQPSSFCGQQGDACSTGADCCGGICNVDAGTKGTCAKPPSGSANCKLVDGELCSGGVITDGGIPDCGGECCSRACAPWGPTGVFICQPASGCRMTGGVCTKDSDCCGSEGMPGTEGLAKFVTCQIASGATTGVCRNPQGCNPDGAVCKLATMSCNATCDCCSGNCNQADTCKQDSLGVPRCAGAKCVEPGGACASSANCCDGAPCVPNPSEEGPRFICHTGGSCVAKCGACTTNADCCPGASCIAKPGSTEGICGPCARDPDAGASDGGGVTDGEAPCALYGQQCEVGDDCCSGVPCTKGTCHHEIR